MYITFNKAVNKLELEQIYDLKKEDMIWKASAFNYLLGLTEKSAGYPMQLKRVTFLQK